MISTFFLSIFNSLIGGFLSVLPIGSIPTEISGSMYYVFGVMNTFNWFFPLDTLFTVLGITLFYELAVLTYHFVMWILRKIPLFNIR